MTLSKAEIAAIVSAEEAQAIGYLGEGSTIQQNRATLLDYYNQRPIGGEIDGRSQIVTSDVHDVVEGMQSPLLRMFTQGKHIGKFSASDPSFDDQAREKTEYANWVFSNQHNSTMILSNMFKDGNLQYTGVVKIYWDDSEDVSEESYQGLSEFEFSKLQLDENFKVSEVSTDDEQFFFVKGQRVNSTGRVKIENIPPDEFMISTRARDFSKPPLIGQRTPKTRSELLEMRFSKEDVALLGKDDEISDEVGLARNHNIEDGQDSNPTSDTSKDVIYLGEYYIYMDVDEDGISELYQVFYSNQKVLEFNRIDDHPYAVFVPIPIPHRAIGTCPADQVADIQYWKTVLVRQMNDNIYSTNFNRFVINERVNTDDVLSPDHGGVVRVEGEQPIADSVSPLPVQSQVPQILQAIEYADTVREIRSGVTRYNQGLDTESLNKTATGFQGIKEMSEMKIELIARHASSAIKRIFNKIVELAHKFQNEQIQLRVHGEVLEIDPSSWHYKTDCDINVGLGAGDRREVVANLNLILQKQEQYIRERNGLADTSGVYKTLERIAIETGLRDVSPYFNDPSKPNELLLAENEQLRFMLGELQAQLENPLTEAEQIRADAKIQETFMKEQNKAQIEAAKIEQKERHHDDEMAVKLTEIEADKKVNVPGAVI